MYVAEIWRYPVKSMAGEACRQTPVLASGIPGDRVIQIDNGHGRVITARTHPGLLGHHATLDAGGEAMVDGRPWTDPSILAAVRQIAGPEARLVRDDDPDARFDVLPLLVATDGAIAAFGRDRRRLRPNLVIGGVHGLDERDWPGRRLHIGDAVIEVDSLRGRCVMTTYDPDSLAHDPGVLRDIVRRFGGRLALNCRVLRAGTIRAGQDVTLFDPEASHGHAALRAASEEQQSATRRTDMKKHIACNDVVPGCSFTASAVTEEELIEKVAAHAKHSHGVNEVTPELAQKVKAAITTRDATR